MSGLKGDHERDERSREEPAAAAAKPRIAFAPQARFGSTTDPEGVQRRSDAADQVRRLAVWRPHSPVTTARIEAGVEAGAPVAVVTANRVVACSHTAREHGVRRGLRRREAQAHCPQLVVLPRDEAAEARVFEPVVAALEAIAPGVEITRPGLAAIGVRGPTRYFGGETGVLHALSRGVAGIPALGGADLQIGIADGAFAAEQAARRGVVVDPGASARFLEELPIETLDPSGASPLIDLLRRLGI